MLEFYVESDLTLRHLQQCPVGKYLHGFAGGCARPVTSGSRLS